MLRRSTVPLKAKLATPVSRSTTALIINQPQLQTGFKSTQPTTAVRSEHTTTPAHKRTRAQWDKAINQLKAEVSQIIPYGPGFFVLTDSKYSSAKTSVYEQQQSATIQAYLAQKLILNTCRLHTSAANKHILSFPGKNFSLGELEGKTLSLNQLGIRAKADHEKGTILILESKNLLEVKLKAGLNADVQLLPRRF